jgi:hypothetical protein
MAHSQVLVYERDGRVAQLLRSHRAKPGSPKWALREPRSLEACLSLLQDGVPTVLILKAGKDVVREFTLLERVDWFHPETDLIVLVEIANPALLALAWDLGATCVLPPPQPHPDLLAVVDSLICRAPATGASDAGSSEDSLVPDEP